MLLSLCQLENLTRGNSVIWVASNPFQRHLTSLQVYYWKLVTYSRYTPRAIRYSKEAHQGKLTILSKSGYSNGGFWTHYEYATE